MLQSRCSSVVLSSCPFVLTSVVQVQIPSLAVEQAKEYINTYGVPVHLVGHFPAYNLFDGSHLLAYHRQESTCNRLTGAISTLCGRAVENSRDLRVCDWWPHGHRDTENNTSVLVRLGPVEIGRESPSTALPLDDWLMWNPTIVRCRPDDSPRLLFEGSFCPHVVFTSSIPHTGTVK
jgi:hypothetical protein